MPNARRSIVLLAAGVASVGLVCGCASSSSPGVAHLSSGRGGSSAGAGGRRSSEGGSASTQQKMVAFARCMRANGVPGFPEPVEGHFELRAGSGFGSGINGRPPLLQSAQKACRKLLPNGGVPTPQERAQMQERVLKFATCMRSHGEPKFPEPEFTTDAVRLGGRIDPNSPQFKAAQKACLKLFPGGPKGGVANAP